MELKAGLSAMVTGGASGIGEAMTIAFAERGIFVTVVDFSEEKGRLVITLIQKKLAKFHHNLNFPSAIFITCDVTNSGTIIYGYTHSSVVHLCLPDDGGTIAKMLDQVLGFRE